MEMKGLKPSILMGKLKQHLNHSISPDTDLLFSMFLICLTFSLIFNGQLDGKEQQGWHDCKKSYVWAVPCPNPAQRSGDKAGPGHAVSSFPPPAWPGTRKKKGKISQLKVRIRLLDKACPLFKSGRTGSCCCRIKDDYIPSIRVTSSTMAKFVIAYWKFLMNILCLFVEISHFFI